MRFAHFSVLALLTASSVAFAANPAERLVGPSLQEIEKLNQPSAAPRTDSVAATVGYTGTIPASPTFNRPSSCSTLSGVGSAVGYHEQGFTVDTSGSYTVEVLSTTMPGADTIMVLYTPSFDPANPLTNCTAYNDDSTGLLSAITSNLTAGTQYVVVTTSFDNGEVGDVSNEITGPGNISLAGQGPQADLGITLSAPTGVAVGGTYDYDLSASNAGPEAATNTTVTVTLPGDVNFVSSTCGATAVGGTVTWNIGTLANGGSQSCSLTVELAGSVCVAVNATATIDATEGDPAAGNNTASAANGGGNLIADPSFEDGSPNGFWTESSTNFGTPLCTTAACGTGGGTAGPRTGTWWAWFGGSSATETATTGQSVTIPAGSTTLDFYFEAPVCSATAGAADFIRLTIDGVEQWRQNASSASCNVDGWQLVSVPVTTFADGNSHAILFESTSGTAGETTNFMVDDVSLASAPTCVAGNTLPDPVPQPAVIPASNGKTLGLMALLLGMVGFAVMRRRD
ncbi:MAG: DUF11 domain-containing protein [Lysobacteraceae bacterium]